MDTSLRWSDELLNEMRTKADPFADKPAAALFEAIEELDAAHVARIMKEFAQHDFAKPWNPDDFDAHIPPEVHEYFNDFTPFDFTDEEKMTLKRASDLFLKHGPAATLALGVRSLLKQYAHTKAIQVLRMTTLLEKHTHRRIIETMQFVMDVMSPDWFHVDPNTRVKLINTNHIGIRSIQKLRLVHAMIRYRIANKKYDPRQGDWDDAWGHPINQEDMVFATQTFSVEVIQGMQELGRELSEQEIEDFFAAWRLIGRALGVDPVLEPKDYAEGNRLQQRIYARHFTLPNDYGPKLSEALIQWLDKIIPLAGRHLVITIIKEFNGPENYPVLKKNLQIDLELSKADLRSAIQDSDLHAQLDEERVPTARGIRANRDSLIETFFITFMDNLLQTERGGKNAHFRMGDAFMAFWDLNRDAEQPASGWRALLVAIKSFFESIWNWLTGLFK